MTKFLTPAEVPAEVVCRTLKVPNSLAWLGIFNKALLAPTYAYNWSDDVPGNMTREEAAEAARVVVAEFLDGSLNCELCLLPDGQPIFRLSELGTWQMLDGTWGEPTGDYALPAYTARTEPTADERRCLAAKNAVNVLEATYEEMTDIAAANLDLAESIFAIGAFLAAIIVAPIGALAVAGMLVAVKSVEFALAITEFVTEDVWTVEYTDALICTFLQNAIDIAGVVTFDFPQLQKDVLEMAVVFDLTLRQQQLAVQVNFMLETIGAEGLDLAGETTAITDTDCDACIEEWCYTVDLTADPWILDAITQSGWDGDFGTWSSGLGWIATLRYNAGINSYAKGLNVGIPSLPATSTYTAVTAVVDWYKSGTGLSMYIQMLPDEETTSPPTTENAVLSIQGVWSSTTPFSVIGYPSFRNGSPPAQEGDMYLKTLTFTGTGTNPFGTTNC